MIKQFLSPGFEREDLYECPSCSEAITNPICHDCLYMEIEKWLGFYPSIKKRMLPKLKGFVKQVNNETLEGINCIACGKKKAALCPYCFMEGIFHILNKSISNKNIVGDFLTIFNFDAEHKGYIQEAKEQGLY